MRKRPSVDSRGFTLMELVIVMVIMSLILAFVGPRVAKSLGGLSIKSSAKKVAGALRHAKSQAVNSGRMSSVIFDNREKKRLIVVSARRAPASVDADNESDEDYSEDLSQSEDALAAQAAALQRQVKIYDLPEDIFLRKITIGAVEEEPSEDEGIYQMTFFPNGTSQGGEILLADSRDRVFQIEVDFLTGDVFVAEQIEE